MINSKWQILLGVSIIIVAVLLGSRMISPAHPAKIHRVVFEVTTDNPEQWTATLNNIENLQKAFGKEQREMEVVAHGKGLDLLLKTNLSTGDRITTIANTGVRFAACENSMKHMHRTSEDLLPAAQTVDSGVAEVVRKQEAGWAYLKSGS